MPFRPVAALALSVVAAIVQPAPAPTGTLLVLAKSDLTLSLVRDADGSYPLIYGTVVDRDGTARHLDRDAFHVEVTDRWVSPATGADYPAGWTIRIPGEHLEIALKPTVAAQELNTRATTGVIYWEGSQLVHATRGGQALGGQGYVELTGYAAAVPPAN